MPLCQLCDEPGADKRWSASLQMAAWTAAAWGVGPWVVMVRGVITVLLHFQVKMGTQKRKSIVGSMLRFACLSHSLTHTGSLSAVRFLLCCRGCCVCDGSDLWNLHSRTPPPLVPEMTSLPSHLTYFYHGSLEETVSAGIAAICGRDSNLSVCSVGLSGPVMQPHERCLEKETQPPTIFAFETSHWLVIILIYFVCMAGYEAGPFNSHPGFSLCAFTVWLWARGHRKERTLKTETNFRQSEISHKTNFYNYHTIVKSVKSKWHLVQNTHTHTQTRTVALACTTEHPLIFMFTWLAPSISPECFCNFLQFLPSLKPPLS